MSMWHDVYVWSMAAWAMDVMLSMVIIIWSNALPESLSHLMMYGVVVWMEGTAETYSGVRLVM